MSPLTRARSIAIVAVAVLALGLLPQVASADDGAVGPAPIVTEAPEPTPEPTPTPTPEPTQPPAASIFGYFTLPWTTTVYESWTNGRVRALSSAAWKKLDEHSTPAPIRYVKTSWSASRYALVTFPSAAGDSAIDRVVTLSKRQYASAENPRVRTVAHVPTSTYFRYASSTVDRYVRTPDGVRHKLTLTQYRDADRPSLTVVPGGYYRTAWSKSTVFVARDGTRKTLSAKQYVDAGKPRRGVAPTDYVKTAWSGPYALITWPHTANDTSVDQVVALTSAQYQAAGRPKLSTRTRIPSDSFVRLTVGKTIYHRLLGVLTPVTTAQWRAAGSPRVSTVRPAKPTYIRGILIVNKSLPLPSSFGNGLRPELRSAFAKMRRAASADGVSLRIISGFRSYASQKSVYAAKIRQYGFHKAQLRSARPGHSEHQTGLAIDVNSISQAWGETKAGRWVARNAHRYGFIVRYPKGKTSLTGYAYEPWHLRHVGITVATHLYKKGLTLDQYLGVPSKY
jgi:hypothetical protein